MSTKKPVKARAKKPAKENVKKVAKKARSSRAFGEAKARMHAYWAEKRRERESAAEEKAGGAVKVVEVEVARVGPEPSSSLALAKHPSPARVELPAYATRGASGMDVRAACSYRLAPGARTLVRTGLKVAVPKGYELQVRSRSGLAYQYGICVLNSPGTIDADFRGEVCVLLLNAGPDPFEVEAGMRIAQWVLAPVVRAHWVEVEQLSPTDRGAGGFGSTGAG